MSKDSSAKYYLDNKATTNRACCERNENLSKEEKDKKNNNIVVNDTKIYQNIKNKTWLNIEKISIKSDAKKMKDYQISKIIIPLYYCKLLANSLAMITQFL